MADARMGTGEIDTLIKSLDTLDHTFKDERAELQGLVRAILLDMDIAYDNQIEMDEDSTVENLYQLFMPYLTTGNSFLKHILEKHKQVEGKAEHQLHELISKSHAEFDKLSGVSQHKYLLDICFVSLGILLDMSKFIKEEENDLLACMKREIAWEGAMEMGVNSVSTIVIGMGIYHPDHAKEFSEYCSTFYASIEKTEMEAEDFMNLMRGHVEASIKFVKACLPKLKHDEEVGEKEVEVTRQDEREDKPEASKDSPKGALTAAIKLTVLPPPVTGTVATPTAEAAPSPTATPATRGGCAIL